MPRAERQLAEVSRESGGEAAIMVGLGSAARSSWTGRMFGIVRFVVD